jgi:hypothetical protein
MLTLYLVALGIGGTLLVASLVMDHEHEADADVDVDADVEADAEVEAGGVDAVLGWLPLTSIRFWTFFLAFAGGTGALFTTLKLVDSAAVTGAIAGGVGWVTGYAAVAIIRRLRTQQTTSGLGSADCIGSAAVVTVAIGKGRTGKINVDIKGRRITLLAETEDDATFQARDRVVVYDVTDDGRAMVTRANELSA